MVLFPSVSFLNAEEFQPPFQENRAWNIDTIDYETLNKKTYKKVLAQNLAQRAQSMLVHPLPLSF